MSNEIAIRFSAWWGAIRAELRRPGWRLALLGTVILYVLKAFAEDTTVRVVRAAGVFLSHLLTPIVNGPLGIAGLVFLGLLFLLVVRAYWETRPQIQAQATNGQLAEQLKEAKTHAEAAKATIKQQTRALEDCQSRHLSLEQKRRYGDSLIEPAPLDAANFPVMFTSVESMMPNLVAMMADANRVWQYFMTQIASSGNEALTWLVQPITEGAMVPAQRACTLLQELVAARRDPRPGLAIFFQRYADWRTWILRFPGMLRQHLYTVPGVVEWQKRDAKYFEDLRQRFATSHFAEVREAAREHGDKYGLQQPIPDPP